MYYSTYVIHTFQQHKIKEMNAEKSQNEERDAGMCILLLLKKEPAYTSDIIQKLQEARS